MDAYTAALQRDLIRWADQAKGHTVDTIYFGGGTPSYLGDVYKRQSSFTAIATKIATFSYSPPQLRRR